MAAQPVALAAGPMPSLPMAVDDAHAFAARMPAMPAPVATHTEPSPAPVLAPSPVTGHTHATPAEPPPQDDLQRAAEAAEAAKHAYEASRRQVHCTCYLSELRLIIINCTCRRKKRRKTPSLGLGVTSVTSGSSTLISRSASLSSRYSGSRPRGCVLLERHHSNKLRRTTSITVEHSCVQ